jgi:TonB family protein
MRLKRWILVSIALISSIFWTMNPVAPAQPAQEVTKNVPVPQDSAPQLSEADRSLACPAEDGQSSLTEDVHKIGGIVKPPKPIRMVNATFTDEARRFAKKQHRKSFEAISLVTLIVNTQGNPQDICVRKPAGFGLDGQAVKAVAQYKFEPATKDGSPVPVRIVVEVNFRLY